MRRPLPEAMIALDSLEQRRHPGFSSPYPTFNTEAISQLCRFLNLVCLCIRLSEVRHNDNHRNATTFGGR